jgi:hypothetical protein
VSIIGIPEMIINVDDHSIDQMNMLFEIGYQRDDVDSNYVEPCI